MVLLDPFYGVSDAGVKITRWMNRILLVAEVAAAVHFGQKLADYIGWETWMWALTPIALMLSIHIVNTVARWLWNIVVVIIYGTTDVEIIAESYARKAEKRRRKQLAKAKAKEDALLEEQRRTTTLAVPGAKVDYGPDYYEAPRKIVTDMFL